MFYLHFLCRNLKNIIRENLALNSWMKVPPTLLPLRKNGNDKTFAKILRLQI